MKWADNIKTEIAMAVVHNSLRPTVYFMYVQVLY
jgi:hypothetical protein